jgi:Leucine-rich repeat (LRR) protein
MPELKYLDLSGNHLPIVKKGSFRNLPSLVGLRLDYNSIIEMEEESFTDLLSLETLILTKNGISVVRRGTFRSDY